MSILLAAAADAAAQTPPLAARVPHTVSSPNGDRADDYYWLRDDDLKAKRAEVMAYLEAENAYTAAQMAPLAGLQQTLLQELRARIPGHENTPPAYDRGWWLWREYREGAEYPLLWRRRGSPLAPDARAPQQLLLDQPALAQGQAYFKVGDAQTSPDGRLLAWSEDTRGRRMYTLRFKHTASGRVLADRVPGTLEHMVWAGDNRTVFYVRQDPVTLQSGPVYRHVLGTDANDDVLVYEEPDKTQFVQLRASASRRWLIIESGGFDSTATRAVPLARPLAPPQVVFERRPGVRHEADHLGRYWVLSTNEQAPNFKLVRAPDRAPDLRRLWRTLVPAREQAKLEAFALFEGAIALQERVDADSRVRLLRNGSSTVVAAAAASTVALAANPDPQAAWLRYTETSMVQPPSLSDFNLKTGQRVLRYTRAVPGFDAAAYATERLWAPARDGKRIPVTLAWRRDRARADGSAPLLVTGYGAYGHPSSPSFSSNRLSLLDRGFVIATAHVRGGADLGEAWYEDGRLMHKQNSFNDFVDATEALLKAGWGDARRVFASGGSAGGLLMGAVANQAGARYRALVLQVPFVDVVTTMLDESIPLTTNEWTQWGDPRQKAAYEYMLSYSPYDNIRAQDYPAMLVTTGLWDSQVQYYEPAKYVARLRATKTDNHPLLLHVNMAAGHGGASGRYEVLAEVAREYAFLLDQAGLAR